MRAQCHVAARILLLVAGLALSGCDSAKPQGIAEGGFAAGAFPPTMSNEDYHSTSWTRTDCLTCHEQGMKEAPVMRHVSVPDLAKDAKCRTCHVLIPDQKARK